MNSVCGNLCKIKKTVDHETHTCENACPYPCFFNDEKMCSNKNHFHNNEFKSESCKIKQHLCDSSHPCKKKCDNKGVCSVATNMVSKTYENKYNKFIYQYVEMTPKREKCIKVIEQGKIEHNLGHFCKSSKHLCRSTCPDCNCFCELEFGHKEFFHSSSMHRNKDCSIYISTEKIFTSVHQNNSVKTAVTYIAGDSATPEICDQYCVTKNRGHTHPIKCEGGDLCMEKTDKGFAIHSGEKFYSDSIFCYYDFVTCDTYWKKLGWQPPNKKTPDVQSIFGKCNFTCGHISHKENDEKVFCEDNLFHSMSEYYCDHNFKCVHKPSIKFDIVFIIDCTGSMSSSFPEVRKIIVKLMDKWGAELNKYAIVGYTDHYPDNGHMPKEIPVSVFPESKMLEDGDANQAVAYVSEMKTGGGGGKYGEALIDGLSEANKLQFRKDSGKIFILICDDSPHGDEFLSNTTYPKGCPCGVSWREQVTLMKTRKVNFIFVKIRNLLNKTVELFCEVYEGEITIISLENMINLETEVTEKVNKTIQTNFVFSKKHRS